MTESLTEIGNVVDSVSKSVADALDADMVISDVHSISWHKDSFLLTQIDRFDIDQNTDLADIVAKISMMHRDNVGLIYISNALQFPAQTLSELFNSFKYPGMSGCDYPPLIISADIGTINNSLAKTNMKFMQTQLVEYCVL
jgi:hypothetical protein